MKKNLLYSLILAFGALFLSTNVAWAQCASGQSEITISLDQSGDGYPDEDGWRLINVTDGITVDSACFGTYASNSGIVTITTCVDTGKTYVFYAYDDFGDGLDGASYTLSYSFGSSIGTLGTNNFNIPASLCNPAYTNNELCDSLSFSAIYVAAPACLPATALAASSIGSDSALLGWTENNSSTSWQIEWGASGFTQGTGTTIITGNNPYPLTGLSPATAYDWYVRSICGPADTSSWSIVNTFTTSLQGPQGITCASGNPGVIFSEDFEATGGWTGNIGTSVNNWIYRTGGTPSSGTGPNGAHSGSQYVFVETSGAGVGTPVSLVSPAIDMNAGSLAAELSLWVHAFGPQIGTLSVGVGTSATGPFTSIFTYSGPIQAAQADPFQNVGADLTAYLGQTIYLEFLYTTNGGYQGDIAIDLVEITSCVNCPAPSALTATNIAADSATLGWTENGTSTNWQIEWGTTGFSQGSGTLVNTSSNPYNLTGLTPVTSYEFYVRSVCAPGDSSAWVGPFSFTTPCAAYAPPYLEDFTSYIPSCWEEAKGQLTANTSFTSTTSSFWIADGWLNVGSSGSARMNIYSTGRYEWLISPSIDLGTAPQNFRLEYDVALTDFSGSGPDVMGPDDTLSVVISTDNGATWSSANTIALYDVNNPPSNTGQKALIDLSTYSGLIKIGFYATSTVSNTDYNVYIDNFQVRIPPACPQPSANAASSVSADSAVFSWVETGTATQWEVEYGTSGYTQGSGTSTIVNVDTFMTINGLTSITTYDAYVRAICGPGDSSAWNGPITFTTLCGVYTAPFFDDVEAHAAGSPITSSLCWTASANNTANDWGVSTNGTTPSSGTGPNSANSGTNFFFFEASGGATGNEALLTSPEIDVTSLTVPMIEFYYHMHGDNRGLMGDLFIDVFDGTNYTAVDSIKGEQQANQSDPFLRRQISLPSATGVIQVRFRAYRGTGAQWGDIAIDDIAVKEQPSCLSPTTLTASNVTSNSAIVSWVEPATATQWEISYDTAGFTAGNGMSIIANTNPDTLTGLASVTSYDWYVRSICAPGDTSSWSPMGSFTTACSVISAPLTESFDATTVPNCWSRYQATGSGWVFGTPGFTWNTQGCTSIPVDHTGNGGNFAAIDFSVPDAGVVLEFPVVDVASLTAPYLQFFFTMCNSASGGNPNVLYIEAYDGTNWNIADSITQGTNGWQRFGYNISAYTYNTSLVRLRFRAEDGGGTQFYYDMGIDDVSIDNAPAADLGITAIIAPTNGCGLSATETVTVEITNYGSAAQTGFNLVYSLDGVLVTPEVFTGSIAAGATANYSFTATANLSVAKSYDIVAYTQLTGDFDNTNDTSSTVVISAANISSFPYAESFESGPAGWIASGAISSWALGAPAGTIINSASDGTQAWVTNLTGAYLANETAALNSPCLDFTNVSNPYLRMDIWYDIESRWDGALVQASTDGGATWSTVGAQGDPVNWYNDTADVIAAKNIDPTGQSWTGDGTDNLPGSGGWISAGHALDNMGGLSSVNLRILFVSDGFVMTEGFAVDHVEIFDSIPMDPYYPIGTINTEDANGVADSLNVVCWTSGTVYGVDLDGNNGLSFHIIDMSSGSQEGINVFNFNDVSNYVVTEGDSIRIHGPVIQFNGLTELNVDSIEIIKTNAFLPQPNLVTDLDESTESQLVRLENLTVTAASSATASSVNYTVTNGTNTMTIRVDGDTDVHDSLRWVAGDTICNVIGIGGQFDNSNPYTSGYQLFPMRFQDIDTCLAIGIEKQVALADYAIYPNPSEGEFTLQTSGFNNSIVNLEIRDLNGRIIQDMQLNNAKSAQVTRITLNGVAKGIYFLAIQDGDVRKIEKLIVR